MATIRPISRSIATFCLHQNSFESRGSHYAFKTRCWNYLLSAAKTHRNRFATLAETGNGCQGQGQGHFETSIGKTRRWNYPPFKEPRANVKTQANCFATSTRTESDGTEKKSVVQSSFRCGAKIHVHNEKVIDEVTQRKLDHVKSFLSRHEPEVPILVIDTKAAVSELAKWRQLMPRVKPFYAIKTHPDPQVIAALVKSGIGFDCASLQEIQDVLQAGAHPSSIIFSNPTKLAFHISEAASKDVNLMVFDSECEVEKLKRLHPKCKAVLRLQVDGSMSVFNLSTKFGASMEEAPSLLQKAKEADLDVTGVSFHVGSSCLNTKAFKKALTDSSDVFKIAKNMQMHFELLNIGGGFPGSLAEWEPSIEEFSDEINKNLETLFPDDKVKIIAEPGRFFATRTTAVLLQVHSKIIRKREDGNENIVHYYMNDGFYGNLGINVKEASGGEGMRNATFLSRSRLGFKKNATSIVWGPTCDSQDYLGKYVSWPELEVGDYVMLDDIGSYGPALAGNFNGFGAVITEKHYI